METKSIPENLIQKVKDFCQKENLAFEPAYLVDYLREEAETKSTRERALAELKIGREKILIIDTPGQIILSKKMISGLSEANIVIILIDMVDKDVKKYHYYLKLASLLGFSEIIVGVNKLDLVGYKKEEYEKFLKRAGVRGGKNFYLLPVSALKNQNLVKKSKLLAWHSGSNLLKILENILKTEEKQKKTEFLMPVQSVLKIGKEKIALGAVLEGNISIGDEIKVFDGKVNKKANVEKLYHNDKKASKVFAGENAGVAINSSDCQIKRGYILHNLPEKPPHQRLASGEFWCGGKYFSEKVEAGLYILEPFAPENSGNYTVRFLHGVYGLKKFEIKKRFNFQLAPLDNSGGKLAANEFCEARIILDKKIAGIKNISARRFVIEDKKGIIVAIGVQNT